MLSLCNAVILVILEDCDCVIFNFSFNHALCVHSISKNQKCLAQSPIILSIGKLKAAL